jgi:hypothetical protein
MARTMRETFAMSRREIMNDPQFDWTRNRATRRRLVVAYVALSLIAAVTFGLSMGLKNMWLLGAFALLLPVFVFVIGSTNASLRGLTEIRTKELDEWQIAKRDAMFRVCWWPGLIINSIAGYIAALTALDPGIKTGVVIGAFFLTLYMPTAALAWTLPEEPEA